MDDSDGEWKCLSCCEEFTLPDNPPLFPPCRTRGTCRRCFEEGVQLNRRPIPQTPANLLNKVYCGCPSRHILNPEDFKRDSYLETTMGQAKEAERAREVISSQLEDKRKEAERLWGEREMMATMTKKALSNQKHDGREGFFSVTRILSFVFPSASKIAEEAEADKLRLLSKKTLKECAERRVPATVRQRVRDLRELDINRGCIYTLTHKGRNTFSITTKARLRNAPHRRPLPEDSKPFRIHPGGRFQK